MLYNTERPYNFDMVVGQEYIVENIRNQSKKDKFFGVYIFGGQYGSGKTTMERIVALAANCEHKDEHGNPCLECQSCKSIMEQSSMDCIEIDGASNTGVDKIRELKDLVGYRPATQKYKVIAIDEVHMLSKQAFNALLKTLEEPPEYCIFILCTTEVNSIPATVRSRAANYTFKRIPTALIGKHLNELANKFSVKLDDDACKLIAKNSDGSMRNALSILDQSIATESSHVTADVVKNLLGIESVDTCFNLLHSLLTVNIASILSYVKSFYMTGKDMSLLLSDLLEIIADAIEYTCTQNRNNILNSEEYINRTVELADFTNLEQLIYFADELLALKNELRKDNTLSTTSIRLIRLAKNQTATLDALLTKIANLEDELSQIKDQGLVISKEETMPHEGFTVPIEEESYPASMESEEVDGSVIINSDNNEDVLPIINDSALQQEEEYSSNVEEYITPSVYDDYAEEHSTLTEYNESDNEDDILEDQAYLAYLASLEESEHNASEDMECQAYDAAYREELTEIDETSADNTPAEDNSTPRENISVNNERIDEVSVENQEDVSNENEQVEEDTFDFSIPDMESLYTTFNIDIDI